MGIIVWIELYRTNSRSRHCVQSCHSCYVQYIVLFHSKAYLNYTHCLSDLVCGRLKSDCKDCSNNNNYDNQFFISVIIVANFVQSLS